MQHFSMSSMPMMIVNEDGVYVETKKHYDNIDINAEKGEVLDPKDLPDTVEVIEKDTTKNNWHKAFQGFAMPSNDLGADAGAFMAVNCSEKQVNRDMHKQAAELEQLAHDQQFNPINLAGQMYDLMSMYHKKMEY